MSKSGRDKIVRVSYDFAKKQHILASDQEDTSANIGVDLLDEDALDSVCQD